MNDFFAGIYEFIYYRNDFSAQMYSEEIYKDVGLLALISALILMYGYYYALNHPRFNVWYHWLIVLAICFGINLLIGAYYPFSALTGAGNSFSWATYLGFGLWNGVVAGAAFFLFSLTLKWWSTNCSETPISLRLKSKRK